MQLLGRQAVVVRARQTAHHRLLGATHLDLPGPPAFGPAAARWQCGGPLARLWFRAQQACVYCQSACPGDEQEVHLLLMAALPAVELSSMFDLRYAEALWL